MLARCMPLIWHEVTSIASAPCWTNPDLSVSVRVWCNVNNCAIRMLLYKHESWYRLNVIIVLICLNSCTANDFHLTAVASWLALSDTWCNFQRNSWLSALNANPPIQDLEYFGARRGNCPVAESRSSHWPSFFAGRIIVLGGTWNLQITVMFQCFNILNSQRQEMEKKLADMMAQQSAVLLVWKYMERVRKRCSFHVPFTIIPTGLTLVPSHVLRLKLVRHWKRRSYAKTSNAQQ